MKYLMISLLSVFLFSGCETFNGNSLKIVDETDSMGSQSPVDMESQVSHKKKVAGELQVETVDYKLPVYSRRVSFPVTVRSHKLQGR